MDQIAAPGGRTGTTLFLCIGRLVKEIGSCLADKSSAVHLILQMIQGEEPCRPSLESNGSLGRMRRKNYNYQESNVHYNPVLHWAGKTECKIHKNPHVHWACTQDSAQ